MVDLIQVVEHPGSFEFLRDVVMRRAKAVENSLLVVHLLSEAYDTRQFRSTSKLSLEQSIDFRIAMLSSTFYLYYGFVIILIFIS